MKYIIIILLFLVSQACNSQICETCPVKFEDCSGQNGIPIKSPDLIVNQQFGGNTDEVIHPSIIYAPTKGWTYWMAVTPYKDFDDQNENPSILVSNDLYTWVEPNGISNPVVGTPVGSDYNADTDMIFDGNYFHMIFTQTKNSRQDYSIRYTRSSDGINWSEDVEIIEGTIGAGQGGSLISPSLVYRNGDWFIYAVDATQIPNVVKRYTTDLFPFYWEYEKDIDFGILATEEVWHLEVKSCGLDYNCAVTTQLKADPVSQTNAIYVQESKTGDNFIGSKFIGRSGGWDDRPYRATLVREGLANPYIVYSAFNSSTLQPYISTQPLICN